MNKNGRKDSMVIYRESNWKKQKSWALKSCVRLSAWKGPAGLKAVV